MAGVNFFQDQPQDGNMAGGWGAPPAGDPNDWQAQQRRGMASMLLRQMPTNQGQMVNGNYVAPTGTDYALQIAKALMQGQQNYQKADAARANTIINGGTAPKIPIDQFKGWVGGLFGGGG